MNILPEQWENYPETIRFNDVITYIDKNYDFTPTKFVNGKIVNEANQNNGSCKIFSFAQLNHLSEEKTLLLFGEFYREDVLKHPDATDHQNIRNFMVSGWNGIRFEGDPLKKK
ncbi:HopJ type III effector protein [Chryseobacterium gossypii]|uniref:HopJ type III effector protein n=1 Tax=Chryseobacterium gossypii TaxID=3231602 RepID=UPI0035250158